MPPYRDRPSSPPPAQLNRQLLIRDIENQGCQGLTGLQNAEFQAPKAFRDRPYVLNGDVSLL